LGIYEGFEEMTFEEFEKAERRTLRERAKGCFDMAQDAILSEGRSALLLEAQFYMQELDRRQGSWIATRDLVLEIVVILLIGGEIWFGNKAATDQGALMKGQTAVLQKLDTSTSATATAMEGLSDITKAMSDTTAASGKTLLSLKTTTETMNKAVHDQVSLFYDPAVLVTYVPSAHILNFLNTGRSNIRLTSLKIGDSPEMDLGSRLITPNSGHQFDEKALYDDLVAKVPKGSYQVIPLVAHFTNEIDKSFVLTGTLVAVWQNDVLEILVQTGALTPVR
jgi:hypothetical protein